MGTPGLNNTRTQRDLTGVVAKRVCELDYRVGMGISAVDVHAGPVTIVGVRLVSSDLGVVGPLKMAVSGAPPNPGYYDSVDGDDGVIDRSGSAGRSFGIKNN